MFDRNPTRKDDFDRQDAGKKKKGPEPIGDILVELFQQYECKFPGARITVMEDQKCLL